MSGDELKKKLKTYRISASEYELICDLLKRPPKGVEWALFSALWSEHCSYKSSRFHLKKFGKTINQKVVTSQGENAGVLDLEFGEKVVFKMESHNHPSFIEPYQGAATGVGGILRDIFTMGAKPVMLADYLCFGDLSAPRMKSLVDGVVRGISGYGNCVGVPTLTGQTNFDSSYNQNILVNAMAVGLLLEGDPLALSGAKGPGNFVVYVGAKTGRDGVHGAAMASESFDENSDAKKPNVQIGDPYFEKLLIESCLEVIKQNLVVAIQDMGAAGLTSSSFEMAAKGQVGMKLDLSKVPLRDSEMGPEEILLSESQERMLLICEPEKFSELSKVFEKWGLDACLVGEVTSGKNLSLWWKGECLTELDPALLTDHAPLYQREFKDWQSKNKVLKLPIKNQTADFFQIENKLNSAAHSSRKWIYSQYDQRVQARTVRGAESDVAFHRLPSGRGLAMTVGCRPWLMKMDAKLGALDAVFYPTLQMAIKGAEVQAITDCLNFGNPEKPEIMSEFVASVDAIAAASLALSAPVISGNVSFYNETLGQNITSTPATGLVGLRPEVENIPFDHFQESGNSVLLVEFCGVKIDQQENQFVGDFDVVMMATKTKQLSLLLGEFTSKQLLSSQMVSQGGLLLSLAKMTVAGLGLQLKNELQIEDLAQDVLYQGIFEVTSDFATKFSSQMNELGFVVKEIGITGGSDLIWKSHRWEISKLNQSFETGFGGLLGGIS